MEGHIMAPRRVFAQNQKIGQVQMARSFEYLI